MSTCVPIVLINVIFVRNVLMSCVSILSILHSAIVAYELIRHHEYDMIIVPSYIPFYMHFNIILVAYLKTWEIDQFGCNC